MAEDTEVVKFGIDFDTGPIQTGKKNAVRAVDDVFKRVEKFSKSSGKSISKGIFKPIKAMGKQLYKSILAPIKDAFKDAFEHAVGMSDKFFSKDLKGLIEDGVKSINIVGKLSGKLGQQFSKAGAKISKKGAGIREAGAKKGGVKGAAMFAGGAALQGLAQMPKAFGGLLKMLGKLGPLLTLVGSILAKIVMSFIDAEASAKEFQKGILASASTIEFLGQSGATAETAYADLKSAIWEVRDAANSLDNLRWGISSDEFKESLNMLNQQGVSLHRIVQEADAAGEGIGEFVSDITHAGVVYSRAFGVPLQEISQMQGELMENMGMSAKSTKLAFAQMTRGALDSGIAANKFYSIIRGVSSDLSTYNARLEDSVKILRLLGKAMNPRNAEKFLSVAMQGLKNMGRVERLRLTLLAGEGKMGALVKRDTAKKKDNLAQQMSEAGGGKQSADDIKKILASGAGATEALIKTLPKELQGTFRDQVTDINLQQQRTKKGTFGLSTAAAGLSPAASLQAMTDALAKWGRGKTLSEGAGTIGMEMMLADLGIGQDQLDQMIKFEAAINNQRDVLKDQLKSNDEGQRDAAREALKRAGITADNDADLMKKIDGAGYDEITNTLDDNTKKQLEEQTKVKSFAEKQTDLTQTLSDKLTVLVDFVMNQLYNSLIDIYDGVITSIPDVLMGAENKKSMLEASATRRIAAKSGNKELQDVATQFGGANKGALAGTGIAKALQNVGSSLSDLEAANKEIQGQTGPISPEQAAQLKANNEQIDKLRGTMEDLLNNMSPDQLGEALKMAGADENEVGRLKDRLADPTAGVVRKKYGVVPEGAVSGAQPGEEGWYEERDSRRLSILEDTGSLKNFAGAALAKAPWAESGGGAGRVEMMGGMAKTLEGAGMYNSKTGQAAELQAKAAEDQKKTADALHAAGMYDPASGKLLEQSTASQQTTADATAGMKDTLEHDGTAYVRFSTAFLKGGYKTTVHDATLKAMRTALFEYYMYSEIEDRASVAKFLSEQGMSPDVFSQSVGTSAKSGTSAKDMLGGTDTAAANATGGIVTGVRGGLAMVRAAAGEGLASVGRGETIVPANGVAGGININVAGVGGRDLERMIRSRTIDTIAEYKRRERLT